MLYEILKKIVEKRDEDVTLVELFEEIHDEAEELKFDEYSDIELLYFYGYYIVHNYHSINAPLTILITEDELTALNEFRKWTQAYRDAKKYIQVRIEKFIKEHSHSTKFYETISDTQNHMYYIQCLECGYVTYIDIIDDRYTEVYGRVLYELEKTYNIKFVCDIKE